MNKLVLTAQSILVLGLSINTAPVQAKDMATQDEIISYALPELADELANSETQKSSGKIRIKCYVDTPAFDQFTYDNCASMGYAHTTTAVFNIENVPAGSTINWSNSNCSSNSTWCSMPISLYQTINLSATVLMPNFTYVQTSATAQYFGWR